MRSVGSREPRYGARGYQRAYLVTGLEPAAGFGPERAEPCRRVYQWRGWDSM